MLFSEYMCHVFVRSDALAGVVIADHEYPSRVCFTLLNKVLDEFAQNYSPYQWPTLQDTQVNFPACDQYLAKYQVWTLQHLITHVSVVVGLFAEMKTKPRSAVEPSWSGRHDETSGRFGRNENHSCAFIEHLFACLHKSYVLRNIVFFSMTRSKKCCNEARSWTISLRSPRNLVCNRKHSTKRLVAHSTPHHHMHASLLQCDSTLTLIWMCRRGPIQNESFSITMTLLAKW